MGDRLRIKKRARLSGMKLMIMLGLITGGIVGGWLGELVDHGNWFGGWSILLSTVGSIIGVWLGFKAGQYIDG